MSLNRPESPCDEDGDSKAKKIRDIIARGYLRGIRGVSCEDKDNIPCIIPQVKDILTFDEQKPLQQCSTASQYNCMRSRMVSASKKGMTKKKCKNTIVTAKCEDKVHAWTVVSTICNFLISKKSFLHSGRQERHNTAVDQLGGQKDSEHH